MLKARVAWYASITTATMKWPALLPWIPGARRNMRSQQDSILAWYSILNRTVLLHLRTAADGLELLIPEL